MRTKSVYLFLAVCIGFSLISFTTVSDFFDNPKNTQRGIYYNFEDYQSNEPSKELDYNIVSTPFYHGFMKNQKVDYFQLQVKEKDERKEMREIFGFRDRFYFYINPSYPKRLPKYRHFIRVEDFGEYWYYKTLPDNFVGQASAMKNNTIEVLFDTNTGEKIILTTKKVEEIIANDRKLLMDFRLDRRNKKHFKKYLKSYFARQAGIE